MKKTLKEIAELLAGKIIAGTESLEIIEATSIDAATKQSITFALEEYLEKALSSEAGAVIVPETVTTFAKPAIAVANPKEAFAKLAALFAPKVEIESGVHPLAYVHPTAKLGKDVSVRAYAIIEKDAVVGDNCIIFSNAYVGQAAELGENCVLHANSVVREFCILGKRVTLQNGAVVGGDGFGYTTSNRQHTKVPQVGNVVLGDDVEVGCNSCIDRATNYKTSTIIGAGTKIDNLVHLAHNDIVGENCLFVAQVGISGSVTIGNNCTFAGQVGSAGHLQIGDNCVFAARSGITNDIAANSFCAGFPARPHKEWLKLEAYKSKLPDLNAKVKKLEKRLAELEKKN